LQAELFKVSTETPPYGHSGSLYCAGYVDGPIKSASDPTPEGTVYACQYPHAYIHLHGPGLEAYQDEEDQDHYWYHKSWTGNNGFGYTLYRAVTLSDTHTCVVHTATPHVHFDPISVQQLYNKETVSANIHIELDCEETYGPVISGTEESSTAIGLQVSTKAFTAAKRLGLAEDGGVEYLVSGDYGKPDFAKGVGIGLYQLDERRRFVGQPGTVGAGRPKGPGAGWYPALQGAQLNHNSPADRRRYQVDFTARLMRLPGQEISPGKVHATATVLVKVQ